MSEEPQFGSPEWGRQVSEGFERAGRQIGEVLGHMQHVMAAQGAMGWAYRGDIDNARAALAGMSPDRLRELSAGRVPTGGSRRRGDERQMKNSITVAGHEVKVDQGEYEDFDDQGEPIIRATGRSAWWCSCGDHGAGPNQDVSQKIRDHLGIDEDGEMRDRGE